MSDASAGQRPVFTPLIPIDRLPSDSARPLSTGAPAIGGAIRERPEDFLVEELPEVEPGGSGEHLYLFVEKRGLSTQAMLGVLARHFRVPPASLGYSGLKDKQAITRQLVSVRPQAGHEPGEFKHDQISILWSDRHTRKLRRGQLAGNRFVIRVRAVDPSRVVTAHRVLSELERVGVPNFFGAQRFGARLNNHLVGAAMARADWDAAIAALLTRAGPTPPEMRDAAEYFGRGDLGGALAALPPGADTERAVLATLARGGSPQRAAGAVPVYTRRLLASAVQSAAFNAYLLWRWHEGLLDTPAPGDIVWSESDRDDRGVWTPVTDATPVDSYQLTGPMWGPGMPRANGPIDDAEVEALRVVGLAAEQLDGLAWVSDNELRGTRRALKARVSNADAEGGLDGHGPYIKLSFDLPAGAYATTVLSLIMKSDGLTGDMDE